MHEAINLDSKNKILLLLIVLKDTAWDVVQEAMAAAATASTAGAAEGGPDAAAEAEAPGSVAEPDLDPFGLDALIVEPKKCAPSARGL